MTLKVGEPPAGHPTRDGEWSWYCSECLLASHKCRCSGTHHIQGWFPNTELGYFIRLLQRQIDELRAEIVELKK